MQTSNGVNDKEPATSNTDYSDRLPRRTDTFGLSQNQLDALTEYLQSCNGKSPLKNLLSKTESAISTLRDLFSRETSSKLASYDTSLIVRIGEVCAQTILDFESKNADLWIYSNTSKESSALRAGEVELITTLGDRPFIISSLTSAMRLFGLELELLLPAVIPVKSKQISVCYIKLTNVSDDVLGNLLHEITATLRDVISTTDDFNEMQAEVLSAAKHLPGSTVQQTEEASLVEWLATDVFLLLGTGVWQINNRKPKFIHEQSAAKGLFRDAQIGNRIITETAQDVEWLLASGRNFSLTKLSLENRVHRRMKLIHIAVRDSNTQQVISIVGLLTSVALSQSLEHTPILRQRLREIIGLEKVRPNSHDHKYIIDTLDRMPKDLALRLSTEQLREIATCGMRLYGSNETRIVAHQDQAGRGISVLVVIPRDKLTSGVRRKVQRYIEDISGSSAGSSEYHLDMTFDPQAKLYIYVPLNQSTAGNEQILKLDQEAIKEQIIALITSWSDALESEIHKHFPANEAVLISKRYRNAFWEEYHAAFTPTEAIIDVENLARLSSSNPLIVRTDFEHETLTIYHEGESLSLSRLLPVLENAGMEVLSCSTFPIDALSSESQHTPTFVYRVYFKSKQHFSLSSTFSSIFTEGLQEVLLGRAENDTLNSLLASGISIKAIFILRTYACLLWQVNKFATRLFIFQTMASSPEVSAMLWRAFDTKFNPSAKLSKNGREQILSQLQIEFEERLRDVTDINRDRVFRSCFSLVEHTVRTNFYHFDGATVLKLRSEVIDFLPEPRPLFELYVRASHFEGCHLRSAKVARGGIRWSDRNDDYRTEILGLMKTQRVKNAVIVPSGAKGGFALRQLPREPAAIKQAVQSCYRQYIDACLSVADNRVGTDVRHPDGLVIYDEPDPYFVVAADRGTATFSDIANDIAVSKYGFWLKDAFASGGSFGYDHKRYAITARGAWECAKRHLNDLGIDYIKGTISVIGIGDMSGDVFGNGLLMCRTVKLVAAFDHKHIFIDPSPDPERSYAERERLFQLAGSQWSDYQASLISKGGAIYGRFDKDIELSPEARQVLGISDSASQHMNGEELISFILKAPVDLLWNGGIGTYVKSKDESHAQVGDASNNAVRVNADELRVRIVSEGGNLGFTQLARVEYSAQGGRINTDAIDNSGGVDLSDHEVNLKLLFSSLVDSGKLPPEERNRLLLEIAPDVVQSVLNHNRSHAVLLSLSVERSRKGLPYYQSLFRVLQKEGYLNRALDGLPNDDDIAERGTKQLGLYRPELAVAVAAVKLWLKDTMLESHLTEETLLRDYLVEYFPSTLRARFSDAIFKHPLARNIVTTQVINDLVDAVGITFVHRMCLAHSVTPLTVLTCLSAAEIILGTRSVREDLGSLDTPETSKLFLYYRQEANRALRSATSWIIRTHGHDVSLSELVKLYEIPFSRLLEYSKNASEENIRGEIENKISELSHYVVSNDSSIRLALFPKINFVFEVLWTERESKKELPDVIRAYSTVLREFKADVLFAMESGVETINKWEHQVLVNSLNDLSESLSTITAALLKRGASRPDEIQGLLKGSTSYEPLMSTIEEVVQTAPKVAGLAMVSRQMVAFAL